jgi:hypothetical protein
MIADKTPPHVKMDEKKPCGRTFSLYRKLVQTNQTWSQPLIGMLVIGRHMFGNGGIFPAHITT